MEYFVLLAGLGETPPCGELSEAEMEAQMAQLGAFDEACAAHPDVEVLGAEAVGDATTAITLRTRGGAVTVGPGPFAEAAADIGGFYVLEAPDLDAVVELCRALPPYDIEIRPVLEMG